MALASCNRHVEDAIFNDYSDVEKEIRDTAHINFFYDTSTHFSIKNYEPEELAEINKDAEKFKMNKVYQCIVLSYLSDSAKEESIKVSTYDRNGNLLAEESNSKGKLNYRETYSYNENNRITCEIYTRFDKETKTDTTYYFWDSNNNILCKKELTWKPYRWRNENYTYSKNGIVTMHNQMDSTNFIFYKRLINEKGVELESFYHYCFKGEGKSHKWIAFNNEGKIFLEMNEGIGFFPCSSKTVYYYDKSGKIQRSEFASNCNLPETNYYDENGNLLKFIRFHDWEGKKTNDIEIMYEYFYDKNGLLTEEKEFNNYNLMYKSDSLKLTSKSLIKYKYFPN
ncbi:MAG: hypothetical protein V2A54_00895 [Bacteroidota bacterium]